MDSLSGSCLLRLADPQGEQNSSMHQHWMRDAASLVPQSPRFPLTSSLPVWYKSHAHNFEPPHLSICAFCLSVRLSFFLSSNYLSLHLSLHLPLDLSLYLSLHLSLYCRRKPRGLRLLTLSAPAIHIVHVQCKTSTSPNDKS